MTDNQASTGLSRLFRRKLPRSEGGGQPPGDASSLPPGRGRKSVLRRALILSAEVVAALVAGVAVLAGLAMWQLSRGPMELTSLTPLIQRALDRPESPVTVSIETAAVTWEGWEHAVDVRARNVIIAARDTGATLLTLPEVTVGFTLAGIESGIIAPTSIRLRGAELALFRRADGSLGLTLAPSEAGGDVASGAVGPTGPEGGSALLRALLRPPSEEGFAGALTRFELTDARVRLDDAMTGLTLTGEGGNLVLTRDEEAIAAALSARLGLGGETVPVRLRARKPFVSGDIDLSIESDPIRPTVLAPLLPEFPMLDRIDLPVAIAASTSFRADALPETASVTLSAPVGTLGADLDWSAGLGATEALVDIRVLDLAGLAEAVPEFADLVPLRAPLAGRVRFLGDLSAPNGAEWELALEAGAGTIVAPTLWPDPLPIAGASLQGLVRGLGREGVLDYLRLDLGAGASLEASGRVTTTADGAGRAIEVAASLQGVDAARLPVLWPPTLAPRPRFWVTGNITAGMVPRATISAALTLPDAEGAEPALDRLEGEIEIQDAEVHYLRPLPPVTGVTGKAVYGADWMTIGGDTGRLLNSRLGRSEVRMTDIGGDDEATITVELTGPLSDALDILDHERFGFITKLGVDKAGLSGEVETALSLSLPLRQDLALEELEVSATATVRDLRQPVGPLGLAVEGRAVALSVDTAGMMVEGPVLLNGVPFALEWDERFSSTATTRSRYALTGAVSPASLALLGVDVADRMEGLAEGTLRYAIGRDGVQDFTLDATLTDAALRLEEIGFDKPAGREATLRATGSIPRTGGPVTLSDLTLTGPGLALELTGILAPEFAGIRELVLRRAAFGETDVSGAVAALPDGGWRIGLTGPRLDAAFLFEDDEEAEEPVAEEPEPPPGPRIVANIAVNRLLLAPERGLDAVTLTLDHDGRDVQRLELEARTSPEDPVSVLYLPVSGGRHTLRVELGDAGAGLSAFDWTDRIAGGALVLEGERANPDAPLIGRLQINDFLLRDAPVVVKVLEFVSFTGALSALRDTGLNFQRLEGEFAYREEMLTISQARAFGPSVGITVRGDVDLARDELDISGAVIPAYLVNRILGDIPILGWIITGGQDEGLLAANYAAKGPIADPAVSVNPLSALAPGILRQILGLEADADTPMLGPVPPPVNDR